MALSISTIESAITKIAESGQSVTVDGVTYNRANLQSLQNLYELVKAETLRSGGTRPLMRAVNLGSMGYDEDPTSDSTPTPVYT